MNQVLESLSRAVCDLHEACECVKANEGIKVLEIRVDAQDHKREVHVSQFSWAKLCSAIGECDIEIHSSYDAGMPWVYRDFKLWFIHEGVEFFCLMTGEEVLKNGWTLPEEPKEEF